MAEHEISPRPAHRPSRRRQILDAAAAEFIDHGVAAVTVGAIAGRAEMTPSAVYYHFANKDEILVALVQRTGKQIRRLLASPVSEVGVEAVVLSLIDRFMAWVEEHPIEARLQYVVVVGVTPVVEELRRKQQGEQLAALVSGPLRALRREMRPTELTVVALGILALLAELSVVLAVQSTNEGQEPMPDRAELLELGLRLARVR